MVTNTKIKELELIQKVKESKCDESLRSLINQHSAICLNIFQKYSSFFRDYHERFNDLLKEKDYLVYRAAITFDPAKNVKFATWLGNYARYECLNMLNSKNNLFVPTAEQELQYHVDAQQEEKNGEKEIDYVFHILEQLNDKRISKIFKLRYFNENASWSKIANKMRISPQTAINLHEEGCRVLRHTLLHGG